MNVTFILLTFRFQPIIKTCIHLNSPKSRGELPRYKHLPPFQKKEETNVFNIICTSFARSMSFFLRQPVLLWRWYEMCHCVEEDRWGTGSDNIAPLLEHVSIRSSSPRTLSPVHDNMHDLRTKTA